MQLKHFYCDYSMALVLKFVLVIAERPTAECMFIEDVVRNTKNEAKVDYVGLFLEELNRKFFLALRYWVTFSLPAVVPRHTVYCRRPLCARVVERDRLVFSVTYFGGCELDMTGTA
jgi:hypothetical protein